MKITELERATTHIGARVNSYYINLLKEAQIPISEVVESMIGKFLTMADTKKLEYICNCKPANLEVSEIAHVKRVWSVTDKSFGKTETLREVLMHTAEQDLAVLAAQHSEYFKAFPGVKQQNQLIDQLIVCLRSQAEYLFGAKLEYDDMVKRLAEKLAVIGDAKAVAVELLEMQIVHKALADKVQTMTSAQRAELAELLGIKDGQDELEKLLADTWPAILAYKLLHFVVDTFEHKKQQLLGPCECVQGFQSIQDSLVSTVCYVALFRQEYRFAAQQKCKACGFAVSIGMKFCSECGAKL